MSKTRASALSRVPNTEKQMKARGRKDYDWLSKFVMEVAKKTGERYPAKTIYGMVCGIRRHLEEKNGAEALRECLCKSGPVDFA